MHRTLISLTLLVGIGLLVAGCGSHSTSADQNSYGSADQEPATGSSVPGVPFAWPFKKLSEFTPRGGTSRGTEVTLADDPSDRWDALREKGLDKKERDRRAILAMSGSYRVSFQFTETMGFTDDYKPPRPYFSWATEHVRVIDSRKNLIRLQHIIVMYYRTEDGSVKGPRVMKHWRQDWRYQDREQFVYEGDRTWHRRSLSPEEVEGAWTQTVYQVDDGLRYEAIGRWEHGTRHSTWKSETFRRPLPRREYTVRDDYDLLQGTNTITITPREWVHKQDNAKIRQTGSGSDVRERTIAREIGINRYERIAEPELQKPASEYWEQTGTFWKIVRDEWNEVLSSTSRFRFKRTVDEKKLHRHLFGRARELRGKQQLDAGRTRREIRNLLDRYVRPLD